VRRKRLIAASLVGSAFLATITAAGAVGLLGERWEKLSEDTWQRSVAATQRVQTFARFYTENLLPIRLISMLRARAQADTPTVKPAPVAAVPTPTGPVMSGGSSSPQMANSSLPRLIQLPSVRRYTNLGSPAYTRFKSWVDSAVNGSPGYAFAASEAAMMYQLSPETKYCTLAVNMVERQVADAEAAIAAGRNPEVAGDSYLEVGPMISDLSMTLHACSAFVTGAQRTRWSAYAEQTVWNIWNYGSARWGTRSAPWTGWSVNNPGNNYHYSFLEATMYWALATSSPTWMGELRNRRLPALQAYFARLPGGGSSEGTGYGTAQMRLFSLYHLWRDATGTDLANTNTHATDSIYYWINATVPTMDRFAPIGDQSRNSVPELYDYHRRLVLEARQTANADAAQRAATWWLSNIQMKNSSGVLLPGTQMNSGFNFRYDLLPAGTVGTPPSNLVYHATGTGHLFARTGWDVNAMWVAIVAGPYNESHAHQDQGSFTLFSRDWLAVTANIWSHSGINQGTDVHNLVRFVRNGTVARQCESTTKISTMAVTPGSGGDFVANANLTPAFCDNTAVTSWQRQFTFAGRKLTVRDTFAMTSGTAATFQVNTPVLPTLVNSREATAGRLRVRVLEPANATINSNFSTGKYVEDGARYRIDVTGGTTGYVVELSEI
ncbi:MAG: hypothetical protein ABWY48_11895, partial [Pseudoxanthomonas sp.]